MPEPTYALTVTVEERNQEFEAATVAYRRRMNDGLYHQPFEQMQEPAEFHKVRVLDVRLTEAEWNAVREAVWHTFNQKG